jgi:hypothetical protein
MANLNTVFGARFVKELFGGSTSGSLMPFTVPATDATAIYVGDFVTLTGEAAASDVPSLGILPVVAQSAATQVICGVVEGFGVDPDNLSKIYRPASTLRTVWVRVNYNSIFTIQSSGTGAAADIGQCADITVGSGSAISGSGMQLDHSTLSSTNGQLKIIGLSAGSEVGAYTKFDVLINESFYKQVAGV